MGPSSQTFVHWFDTLKVLYNVNVIDFLLMGTEKVNDTNCVAIFQDRPPPTRPYPRWLLEERLWLLTDWHSEYKGEEWRGRGE